MFSNTSVTDHNPDTTFFNSEHTGCGFLVNWFQETDQTFAALGNLNMINFGVSCVNPLDYVGAPLCFEIESAFTNSLMAFLEI